MHQTKTNSITTSFSAEERASLTYPIIGAFFAPILIGLFKPSLLWPFHYLFVALIFVLPTMAVMGIFYDWIVNSKSLISSFFKHIKPLPSGIIFGTDLKRNVFPWATFSLITINAFLFLTTSEETIKPGLFLPYGNPSPLHIFISFFTCTFLHADIFHLSGNMLFLWVFGSAVEPRVGSLKFLTVYFFCILFSGIFVVILLILKAIFSDSPSNIMDYHSLGASGVISGIMGVFIIRCYFARISITIPFLFLPLFSLPLRVQGTLLTGLFFAIDLAGSSTQFRTDSRIAYWAHVGGYVGGFILGYFMKLHHDASKEAVEVKAERLSHKVLGKKDATRLYKDILNRDPENEEAIRYLLELHRYNQDKREEYFARLIQVLVKKDFAQAISLFEDNFPNLMKKIPGQIFLRFGLHFYKSCLFEKAWPCLELASEKEGSWQAKAMYSLGLTYKEMGRNSLAEKVFERIKESFPNSPFHKSILQGLGDLD